MTRIKKHRNEQNHQEKKHHRRKSNIPELVYKYLIANEGFKNTERRLVSKCRCCGEEKHHDEVIDSSRNIDRGMGYKIRQGQRKNSGRISKLHNIKRHPISNDLPISNLRKCVDGEDTRKARKYMKKALDFGVESGYLIPSDPMYKILRVSSDLMKSDSRRSKSICNMALSKSRNIPTRLDDLQEQKGRRRRRSGRRGRRSRSGSRMRKSRRRGRRSRSRSRVRTRNISPQNPEEVIEDKADDYEMDKNDPKSNIHTDDVEGEQKTVRSNQSDDERLAKKAEEDGSDLSVNEDETDDEDETKKN